MPGMSPRIKLKKGRALVGHPNVDPTINITVFVGTVAVDVADGPYVAVALDAEQGDISSQIIWTIVGNGSPNAFVVATGGTVNIIFPDTGAQTLTASITDSFGVTITDTQAITVTA